VVLAAPRTGSNLLCTLLNSHPEVLCHHEVFNPGGIFWALEHRDSGLDLGTIDQRDRDPLAFLKEVWNRPMGAKAVGFKWTRGQNRSVLDEVVGDPLLVKFILRRRNKVKTFVSEMLAQRTDQWEVYEGEKLVPRPQIRIEVEDLQAHIECNEQMYREILSSTAGTAVELFYEDLIQGDDLADPFSYLGVTTGFRPKAKSIKQNPCDLRTVVANFHELEVVLDGELRAQLESQSP
jgi:LPS sulfotransferase NodH